ncbi:ATP-dependent DNA ligase [Ferruginibacter sp.]|uniref:ATP-dependent DNA ligase n=1 Tax=Ferruginibacter sp. TaxID=1940288 RepID=UPI0019C057B7|nr:ATP-dependent DNA ligase [Ferruginibacter sp.]MBC7627227.1 ATP-dependent DNA ligase [Ferruginibacter sp.]
MKQFAKLVSVLGTSTKTNDKLQALQDYFAVAAEKDKVWVIAIFSGRRPKRIINSTILKAWCMELTGISPWLFDECYHTAGDLAETISLLLPEPENENNFVAEHTLSFYLETFIRIEKQDELVKKQFITSSWQQMDRNEKFVFNKLITGGFRIGVSQTMMVKALAKSVNVAASVIAHRISGNWNPAITTFENLLSETVAATDFSKPYPFYLAYAVDEDVTKLEDEKLWQAEWKWDGIRGQIIKRDNNFFVWSRGEELLTEKFPEYNNFKDQLQEGTVIDGEIISLSTTAKEDPFKPLPFAALQTRIGRKTITKKQLTAAPVGFIAYDLLEFNGEDIRYKSMAERRDLLEQVIANTNDPSLHISPVIAFTNWQQLGHIRAKSREMGSEGIMLKRKISPYQAGRKRGDWWKWKIDPLTIDAVMIYAQKGHGRRSNLYTDYTFAVKDGDKLVPFTKAYTGLTDKEFAQVDSFVKKNSIEKFGPVRTVKPELVFEIAFEGIAASNRHKSGVALRFPRMNRWRTDKKTEEINTLDDLKNMLTIYNQQSGVVEAGEL